MKTPPTTACCNICWHIVDRSDRVVCTNKNCPCHSKTRTHTEEGYHEIERILTDFKNGATYSDSIEKVQALLLKQRKETLEEVRKAFTDEDYQCGKHKRFLAHLATLESSN